MKPFTLFCSSALVVAGILSFTSCGKNPESGLSMENKEISVRSVDPYHALVEAEAGAFGTSHVFFMLGDQSTPDTANGEFEEVEEGGGLRFVLDLLPGDSLTLWASPSEHAKAEEMSDRLLLTAANHLPAVEDGGTGEADEASLVAGKIKLTSLDGHHALLEGEPGAAGGEIPFPQLRQA